MPSLFVIYICVLCVMICMLCNYGVIIDHETLGKATEENVSNLKGKCWDCLVKTASYMVA